MTNALFLFDPDRDNVPVNSDESSTGWKLTLPPQVKRHAVQAMRLKEGDGFQLSDGKGLRLDVVLDDAQNGIAEVESFMREERPVTRLALVQALTKNGHDEQAIDIATQIGADVIVPWQADRSIAKWKTGRTDRKWLSTLQAATEQSRRAWTPELSECVSSKQIVSMILRANVHGDMVIVLHQDATDTWASIEERVGHLSDACLGDGKPRTVYVVVGPEGGISEDEVGEFVKAGAKSVVLGRNILRASTAGPVALSLLSRSLGRYE
ncbi:16S rRNA (uracil(1498)-N(3))-methyltransferase [Bifidobacterium merycicum]|uniref:Ribosomal RNA small subunit methyltransferase E n=1 Tax=Bifidobacterium merycicum TaxID=78345 RepID=A0A087BGX1_9BIFI|nr:16S rRNA (uracil(1498)-N(3))-methyltransferase [Bifidobacterium merycicum]KFI70271.1 16S ribosomal RNA methyltransferase RsmE [Bifidobacterium merycicum]SHE53739.1 16S rRNA (uracil1498-N3)-methyltransferase [Bifidobacterium merycicum DSM 6492]